jgi:hypothetical protein
MRGRSLLIVAMIGISLSDHVAAQSSPRPMLDLSKAVVCAPADLSGPEKKAVALLVDEVNQRTSLRWEIRSSFPKEGPIIAVGQESSLQSIDPRIKQWLGNIPAPKEAEGYRIHVKSAERVVLVVGNDARGVLFSVGRLLRELRTSRNRALLPNAFQLTSAPKTRLRGHQLGYRPKTNSYDGWDLDQWEQYYRDLAVFGTNTIELIPPRSDDASDSPHFPRPPMEMMIGMSRLANEYGLDVSIWHPAMDANYGDPKTVEFALREWDEVFQRLPRIDAVFVPGGDPGHTPPKILMNLLEKQAQSLRRRHPKAEMWVSPQSFNKEWLDDFLKILQAQPTWLTGVVFGPQVRIRLSELRTAVPKTYPIRNYPDITHSINCQYPVPDWDLAFALTQGREVINPRPLGQAAIFKACQDHTVGFVTYSEGCNDDVNKFIWSSLSWDPDARVVDLLRQYSRYFIGDHLTDSFAQGLLGLERNWQGPLATNTNVETILQQFQAMEQSASPRELLNWRFQQALYRAYFDASVRDRLIVETASEVKAMEFLRMARSLGSLTALDRAQAVLDHESTTQAMLTRRARTFELAEALFQSIHMQLSVTRFKAISIGRGATQDTIDVPLNNRIWLKDQFRDLHKLDQEQDRLDGIATILHRSDPGPGGFYDNLGDPARQPRLSRGFNFANDPDYRRSSLIGFDCRRNWPLAWCRNAQSLYDTPLLMHYEELDPEAHYRIRIVYGGDNLRAQIRLDADDWQVHPLISKPNPLQPVEFDVPIQATSDGRLTLRFTPELGRGGNGRGCQVSEVWLMRAAKESRETAH